MKNKWSKYLCKTSISSFLIDEVINAYKNKLSTSQITTIQLQVKNKQDFKALKQSLSQLKPVINNDLFARLQEELKEIKSDITWIGTKRGIYITNLNEWTQSFKSEFDSIDDFKDIYIGGHVEKMVVFLTGKIKNEVHYENLLKYIHSKTPPYKIFTAIDISNVIQ